MMRQWKLLKSNPNKTSKDCRKKIRRHEDIAIETYHFAPGTPKFTSFSYSKYIHSIPAAPKVLTHSSINSKV